MALSAESEQPWQLKRVADLIRKSGRSQTGLSRFADIFLGEINESDFADATSEGLAALAISAWDFLDHRKSRQHKIRAFNVDAAITGGADVTIIEILNDDMPFLVDSIMGEILGRSLAIHLVIHPLLLVERDGRRKVVDVARPSETENGGVYERESYIQIHVGGLGSKGAVKELTQALDDILNDVRTVVSDWRPMVQCLERTITAYTTMPPPVPVSEIAEAIQFLRWLINKNFTFLGMRAMAFVGGAQRGRLEPVAESGLGILRDSEVRVLRRGRQLVRMTPEIRKFFLSSAPLIITKANVVSRVHRRTHMDYIGIKLYGETAEFTGELRMVGLFTSGAYTSSVKSIPVIRHKVDTAMRYSGFAVDGQGGKALLNVLETYPRDEIIQIETSQLLEFALAIQQLKLQPKVRVLSRIDEFDRFVSVIVYVPRDRFSTDRRKRIGAFLADTYRGRVSAFYPFFPEGPLVRLHYIIGRYEGRTPVREQAFLETEVTSIIRTWNDRLRRLIERAGDAIVADRLWAVYQGAFPAAYQESISTARALVDIARIEGLTSDAPVAIDFYQRKSQSKRKVRVALYNLEGPIPLSRRVPIFENFGFAVIDELSYRIASSRDGEVQDVSLHDMLLEVQDGKEINLEEHKARLEACFLAVWRDEAASDHYNRLVLKAGMVWREAAVMRAYGAYLRQICSPFGQSYLCGTLLRHIPISENLMELFRQRFDPDRPASANLRKLKEHALIAEIEGALEEIPSLDEDRIIRQFLSLIVNTLRTNFYQMATDGSPPPVISFKLDSDQIDATPQPRPFAEIFVYSPQVEGIHLRGGKIARGGLRWSDRPQDFRTEVLGLAKAQQVKNTVIVPTGAKGGFVPQRLPENGAREDIIKEGVAAYKNFINALLAITDNLQGGKIVPPKKVIRHDSDDPYLVVAADKGTATLSDTANEISAARHFWLGDAFASGGSAGYDHKKIAITARGGWEAVQRHFREMDIDIQTKPFQVIGIGDMSGDVFGNGMLQSKKIKLLAAFDHRDIFIDPDPDPEKSWTERRRLFNLKRSSWHDYSKKLISKGGGVFSRQAKSIVLTAEIKAITGLTKSTATPNEVMRALLKSEVDLLWFGGIGSFVRARGESDEQVGDRANDSLRIDAEDLAVKMVGEGANLGMTQRARIAFARAGGRVNTDAIDNSAGVNSSDLEVNIKIALGQAIESGKLNLPRRNTLLAGMTNEVADACVRNNYLQTLALSLAQRRGHADFSFYARQMRDLERSGLLDREIEYLPDDVALTELQGRGEALTRPELAVLLAYAKIALYNELIISDVPDDPFFERELMDYFPPTMKKRYAPEIESHRLRREIITTQLANVIVNRSGSTMVVRLKAETGHGVEAIALAFSAARAIFDLEEVYGEIDRLDNKIGGQFQLELYLRVQDVVHQQTHWFLRHSELSGGLGKAIGHYHREIAALAKALDKGLTPLQRGRMEADRAGFVEAGVGDRLARRLSSLPFLAAASDVIIVANQLRKPVTDIAAVFAEVAGYFRIDELRFSCDSLLVDDYFDRLAINNTSAALADVQRALVHDVIAHQSTRRVSGFEAWCANNRTDTERARARICDILDSGEMTLSKFTVATTYLRELVSA